jgi:hypothetical protein
MSKDEDLSSKLRPGRRVTILYPEPMINCTGSILGPEILGDGQASDRWLIQVETEEGDEVTVLSLSPDEFHLLD